MLRTSVRKTIRHHLICRCDIRAPTLGQRDKIQFLLVSIRQIVNFPRTFREGKSFFNQASSHLKRNAALNKILTQ